MLKYPDYRLELARSQNVQPEVRILSETKVCAVEATNDDFQFVMPDTRSL